MQPVNFSKLVLIFWAVSFARVVLEKMSTYSKRRPNHISLDIHK